MILSSAVALIPMIITCPACSTKYTLRPGALGDTGRTVRCSRCHASWHQDPTEPIPAPAMEAPAHIIEVAPEPAEDEIPRFIAPTPEQFRPPAEPKPRLSGPVIGFIGLAAVVLLLLGGLALFRSDLVAAWPASARLYALIDWAPPYPLQINGVNTSRPKSEGGPVLVVAGEIANTSSRVQPVPKLRVVLRDAKRNVISTTDFSTSRARLLPGESAPFQTSVINPPNEAERATVSFVTD